MPSSGDNSDTAAPFWKRTTNVPATPSQMQKYLDQCTDWLLNDEPLHGGASSLPIIDSQHPGENAPRVEQDRSASLGIRIEELGLNASRACFCCEEGTREVRIANPFSKAHLMAICRACQAARYDSV